MYRTVAASFWTDPKVRRLPSNGKLLFLYFITGPHTHVSGIYVLPRHVICYETGLSNRMLDTLYDILSIHEFCSFDPDNDIVWVRKMLGYQGRGEKNLRSAAAHVIEDLHNSFLCKQFLEAYPAVTPFISEPKLHTLYHRVSRVGTPDSRSLIPDSRFLIPEQEQEKGSGDGLKNAAARPRDLAADYFAEKHLDHTGVPYEPATADFVLLAKLRKLFKTEAREMPPDWEAAVQNYFASALGQYSLADLANPKRYAVFKNSALDGFNKPITHANRGTGNGNRKSKDQLNAEAAQRLLSRLDSQDCGSGERGTERSEPSGVSGETRKLES